MAYNARRICEAGQWYNIRYAHAEQPLCDLGGVWFWSAQATEPYIRLLACVVINWSLVF